MEKLAKQIAQTVIKLLEDQQQTELMPEVLKELEAYWKSHTHEITIESAHPLEQDVVENITSLVAQKLGFEPQVKQVVNPDLIGGLRVKVYDQLIDATIRGKLNEVFEKIH